MMSTSNYSPYLCTDIILYSKFQRKMPMNVKLRYNHRIMLGIKTLLDYI